VSGTEKVKLSPVLEIWVQASEGEEGWRKHPELRRETDPLRRGSETNQTPQKSPKHHKLQSPVPETDTGREVENTKGREITLSKELGKMTP
jgi:hypothetical protein